MEDHQGSIFLAETKAARAKAAGSAGRMKWLARLCLITSSCFPSTFVRVRRRWPMFHILRLVGVFFVFQYFQIFRTVIRYVTVLVVSIFIRKQTTSNNGSRYKTMFHNISSLIRHWKVRVIGVDFDKPIPFCMSYPTTFPTEQAYIACVRVASYTFSRCYRLFQCHTEILS